MAIPLKDQEYLRTLLTEEGVHRTLTAKIVDIGYESVQMISDSVYSEDLLKEWTKAILVGVSERIE